MMKKEEKKSAVFILEILDAGIEKMLEFKANRHWLRAPSNQRLNDRQRGL